MSYTDIPYTTVYKLIPYTSLVNLKPNYTNLVKEKKKNLRRTTNLDVHSDDFSFFLDF